MPGRDKTGPLGRGPMTGRGFGDCNETYDADRPYRGGSGRRFRQGGYGRGFGGGFYRRFRNRDFWGEREIPGEQSENPADINEKINRLKEELKKIEDELARLSGNEG